ncbi:hypothetical protein HML84_07490 [Alcanivorax sp. IO_7]|nr:hypothetical protein HML84_07490 [Alcanivorax sp. IO_7]
MRFEAVHPGTVAVWRVQTLVGVAVLLLGLAAVFAPLLAGGALALPALGVWGLALLVLAGLGWWGPAAWYRRLRYRLDERGLSVERACCGAIASPCRGSGFSIPMSARGLCSAPSASPPCVCIPPAAASP